MIGVGLLGVRFAVPDRILTNQDLEKMVDTTDEWIQTRTGIRQRHILSEGESSVDLGARAAEKLLQDLNFDKTRIDALLVATATPEMLFPSTACILTHRLGLNGIPAFDFSAACSGFVYGLSIIKSFIESGAHRTVLLVCVEALSKIVNWQDRSTCVLFGDGAGAALLSATETDRRLKSILIGADGQYQEYLYVPLGGTVAMSGRDVFQVACRKMTEAATEALSKAHLTLDDIDLVIPHQANTRIISQVAKLLRIPEEKFFVNIQSYGNTSAASIPIAYREAEEAGRVRPGSHVLFVAFGGGFTWGAAVLKV
ncbi:MAG: 3-oxoacyl-ACP synthase [Candidatus Lindowbacteria bacterium RIFCSPLOWO2_12_FULL_62_27]|nr:MAG: 3-oxoacyl-ACP synthase [Candidatus Lindowbacteria bacterium RIFCSPLOWO2_12_FULL_62_27]OGH63793.1 MAG: 3-oxoacyl-ACP synthase [Candidatus Lindowbacteria bacterium RIFCSPLOWO2_02_FULL_62_12]